MQRHAMAPTQLAHTTEAGKSCSKLSFFYGNKMKFCSVLNPDIIGASLQIRNDAVAWCCNFRICHTCNQQNGN